MTFYSWTRSLASSIPRACHARTTLIGNRVHVRNRESVLGVSSRSHPPVFTLSPSLLKGKWPWSRPLCYLNALLKLFTTRRHCVRLHRRLWAGEGICSTGLLPCCCCVQSSGILPCFALTVVFSTAFRTAKVCVWFFNYVRLIFCPISCSFTDLWLRVTVSAKLWYNDRFRPTGEQTRVNLGRILEVEPCSERQHVTLESGPDHTGQSCCIHKCQVDSWLLHVTHLWFRSRLLNQLMSYSGGL